MMGPKSTSFIKIEFPASMNTLNGLLEVLRDPGLYQKQIEKLKDYIATANETIETLGKAEKIDNLLTDAQRKQEETTRIFDNAKTNAAQILAEARQQADEIINNAQQKVESMQQETQQNFDRAKQLMDKAKADEQKSSVLAQDAKQKLTNLEHREKALEKAENEIARKKAVLSQL